MIISNTLDHIIVYSVGVLVWVWLFTNPQVIVVILLHYRASELSLHRSFDL